MSMHTGQSRDLTPRAKRSAKSVSNPNSPDYDVNDPEYDESLDDSRGNSAHLKNRPKNRADIGLDAPEMSDTVSPAPGTEEDSETFAPPRALGFGGNLASIQPGAIQRTGETVAEQTDAPKPTPYSGTSVPVFADTKQPLAGQPGNAAPKKSAVLSKLFGGK